MREIRYGLERNVDVSKYADPKFSWAQMFEISLGLKNGVDVDKYADSKFTPTQMEVMIEIGRASCRERV